MELVGVVVEDLLDEVDDGIAAIATVVWRKGWQACQLHYCLTRPLAARHRDEPRPPEYSQLSDHFELDTIVRTFEWGVYRTLKGVDDGVTFVGEADSQSVTFLQCVQLLLAPDALF